MRAEEAFNKAKAVKDKLEAEQLDKIKKNSKYIKIIEKITKAANNGEEEIYEVINTDLRAVLVSMGYNIEGFPDGTFKIGWCCK